MIRILHVVPNMQAGGLETLIMNWYRNIDRTKVQFDFLVHYQGEFFYDKEIRELGGKIYHLSVRDDGNMIKYIKDLDRFFAEHTEYKIVHGHMESTGYFYFRAAKKHGVPVRIAHSHNSATEPTLKGFVKGLMLKGFPLHATNFFACSDIAGRFMFGNRNFIVMKNAIEPYKFRFDAQIRRKLRKELGVEGKFVVGHVGRFCTQKNHRFLMEVFHKLHEDNADAVLLLVGKGELLDEVKEKVRSLGLEDCVKFLGVRDDVNHLYQAMDVFLFPSLFEGLGIVAIEAQTAALMTVCSSEVPGEADISDYFISLPLEHSAEQWAACVNQFSGGYERKDTTELVADAGYDIVRSATLLQEFYCEQYEKR